MDATAREDRTSSPANSLDSTRDGEGKGQKHRNMGRDNSG